MKDLIKEYGLRFTISALIFIILLLVRIYLVPIMSWYIFWFALSLPLSFGYCYLIWYSTDYPQLYKEPEITIRKPDIYDFQQHNEINHFTECYDLYVRYQEQLKKIKDSTSEYSNRDGLILAVLLLFFAMPMVVNLTQALKHLIYSTVACVFISLPIVVSFLGVSLWVTKKIYYPEYCLKDYERSENDFETECSKSFRTHQARSYNYKKMYDHFSYLSSIERGLEFRHKIFVHTVVVAFLFLILSGVYLI